MYSRHELQARASGGYGKWDAVYETTQAIGLTTFSKLTEKFINTRYRKGVKVKWDGTKK